MKTFCLTLKKKWFDMILSGEKTEEYREFKPYWISRLCCGFPSAYDVKDFDVIEFRNGYSKNSPRFKIECKGIIRGQGAVEWGAEPNTMCFIIKLGKIKEQFNIEKFAFDVNEPCYCDLCGRHYKNYKRFCIHMKKNHI